MFSKRKSKRLQARTGDSEFEEVKDFEASDYDLAVNREFPEFGFLGKAIRAFVYEVVFGDTFRVRFVHNNRIEQATIELVGIRCPHDMTSDLESASVQACRSALEDRILNRYVRLVFGSISSFSNTSHNLRAAIHHEDPRLEEEHDHVLKPNEFHFHQSINQDLLQQGWGFHLPLTATERPAFTEQQCQSFLSLSQWK